MFKEYKKGKKCFLLSLFYAVSIFFKNVDGFLKYDTILSCEI